MSIIYRNITEYIPIGQENAISARKLADIFGISLRELRKQIEVLRSNGVLICSTCRRDGGGYYRPRNSDETAEYFRRQLSRIGHIWTALSPFKKYLNDLPIEGQVVLDELSRYQE